MYEPPFPEVQQTYPTAPTAAPATTARDQSATTHGPRRGLDSGVCEKTRSAYPAHLSEVTGR